MDRLSIVPMDKTQVIRSRHTDYRKNAALGDGAAKRRWMTRLAPAISSILVFLGGCGGDNDEQPNIFGGTGGTGASGSGGFYPGGNGATGGTSGGGGAGGTDNPRGAGAGAGVGAGAGGAGTSGGGAGGAAGTSGTDVFDGGGVNDGGGGFSGGTGGTGGAGGGTAGAGGGTTTPGRSAGCGKTSTITFEPVPGESGSNVGTGEGGYVRIQSSGQERGFAMRLPDNYDNNQPYWLIFGFHWNGGNSMEVDTGGTNGYISAHFGLQKMSNNGAIFVAADGLGGGWANTGGRDLVFVDDMLKLIEDNYCVDTTHIFSNGFSYGGMMSYAIACARAKVFRGVAIYEGAALSGCVGGTDPIAYWQMAGLTDNTCTLAMALPMRDAFVANNQCNPQNPPQPPQPPPFLSSGGHICTDYEGCTSGYPVRWCVHQSGHGWAVVDGTDDVYNSCATPPNSCSTSCPCSWVPEDVWTWMTSL